MLHSDGMESTETSALAVVNSAGLTRDVTASAELNFPSQENGEHAAAVRVGNVKPLVTTAVSLTDAEVALFVTGRACAVANASGMSAMRRLEEERIMPGAGTSPAWANGKASSRGSAEEPEPKGAEDAAALRVNDQEDEVQFTQGYNLLAPSLPKAVASSLASSVDVQPRGSLDILAAATPQRLDAPPAPSLFSPSPGAAGILATPPSPPHARSHKARGHSSSSGGSGGNSSGDRGGSIFAAADAARGAGSSDFTGSGSGEGSAAAATAAAAYADELIGAGVIALASLGGSEVVSPPRLRRRASLPTLGTSGRRSPGNVAYGDRDHDDDDGYAMLISGRNTVPLNKKKRTSKKKFESKEKKKKKKKKSDGAISLQMHAHKSASKSKGIDGCIDFSTSVRNSPANRFAHLRASAATGEELRGRASPMNVPASNGPILDNSEWNDAPGFAVWKASPLARGGVFQAGGAVATAAATAMGAPLVSPLVAGTKDATGVHKTKVCDVAFFPSLLLSCSCLLTHTPPHPPLEERHEMEGGNHD